LSNILLHEKCYQVQEKDEEFILFGQTFVLKWEFVEVFRNEGLIYIPVQEGCNMTNID